MCYDQNIIKMIYQTKNFVETERKSCTSRWISEEVPVPVSTADKQVNVLQKRNGPEPILINAPTGSGKSTFVLRKLAEDVKITGQFVLFLCNRTALSIQQKQEKYHYDGLLPTSIKQLKDDSIIGNIAYYTYQSILKVLTPVNQLQHFNFKYIVFDEVHFLTSDAAFNAETDEILATILCFFPQTQRIYMTATPKAVMPMVASFERFFLEDRSPAANLFQSRKDYKIQEYFFSPDFKSVSLHFFYEWKSIATAINDDESQEKWLIFVRDKDSGRHLCSELGKKLASYLDADKIHGDSKILQELIYQESFMTKALITTSVLDNGINIKDPNMTNIVIDFADETQFLQMLGRKRREPEEKVRVYVKLPEIKEVSISKNQTEALLNLLNDFSQNPQNLYNRWGTLSEAEQKLFRAKFLSNRGVQYSYNLFAWHQLRVQAGWLEQLKMSMETDERAYARQVCEWLGKRFSDDMIESETKLGNSIEAKDLQKCANEVEEALEAVLEGADSVSMEPSKLQELESQLINIVDRSEYNRNDFKIKVERGSNRSATNIRNIIDQLKLPYKLSGKKNKSRFLSRTPRE